MFYQVATYPFCARKGLSSTADRLRGNEWLELPTASWLRQSLTVGKERMRRICWGQCTFSQQLASASQFRGPFAISDLQIRALPVGFCLPVAHAIEARRALSSQLREQLLLSCIGKGRTHLKLTGLRAWGDRRGSNRNDTNRHFPPLNFAVVAAWGTGTVRRSIAAMAAAVHLAGSFESEWYCAGYSAPC